MRILNSISRWWSTLAKPQPQTAGYEASPHFGAYWSQKTPPFSLWAADRMVRDHQVSFGLAVGNAPLYSAKIEVTGPADVAAFVQDQWTRIWAHHAREIMRTKHFGFAGFEVMSRESDGRIEFDRLLDRSPYDTTPLLHGGQMVGVRVRSLKHADEGAYGTDHGYADLPRGKSLWLTYGTEYGRRFGRAILETPYPAWYEKAMDSGAIDLRRLRMIKDAWIGDVIQYPMGQTATDGLTGNQVSFRDALREACEVRQSGGVLTLPMVYDDQGRELVKYTPPTSVSGATQILEWIDKLDWDILDGLHVPKEVVEAAATGSGFSGRSIPFVSFLSIRDQEFADYVRQVDEQLLKIYVWLNFGASAAKAYEIKPVSLLETVGELMGPMGQPDMQNGGQPGQQPPQFRQQPQQFSVDDHGNEHSAADGRFVPQGDRQKKWADNARSKSMVPLKPGANVKAIGRKGSHGYELSIGGKVAEIKWHSFNPPVNDKGEINSHAVALLAEQGITLPIDDDALIADMPTEEALEQAERATVKAKGMLPGISAAVLAKARPKWDEETIAEMESGDEYPPAELLDNANEIADRIADRVFARMGEAEYDAREIEDAASEAVSEWAAEQWRQRAQQFSVADKKPKPTKKPRKPRKPKGDA